jgi:hypothetical protein
VMGADTIGIPSYLRPKIKCQHMQLTKERA